jgi:hypothetical protein
VQDRAAKRLAGCGAGKGQQSNHTHPRGDGGGRGGGDGQKKGCNSGRQATGCKGRSPSTGSRPASWRRAQWGVQQDEGEQPGWGACTEGGGAAHGSEGGGRRRFRTATEHSASRSQHRAAQPSAWHAGARCGEPPAAGARQHGQQGRTSGAAATPAGQPHSSMPHPTAAASLAMPPGRMPGTRGTACLPGLAPSQAGVRGQRAERVNRQGSPHPSGRMGPSGVGRRAGGSRPHAS